MNKRGYLQISFAWLFAIVVGAVILFLAIFAATKLINTEQTTQDAKIGKEISILLNPLETSFETGKTTSLTLPVETRIYNKCKTNELFGKQGILISQKSFGKWTDTNIEIEFVNKYLFSENYVEGEKFYLFSKPFDLPFKITDLIYITSYSKKYCFINAPEPIKNEILALNQGNFLISDCPDGATRVCFSGGSNCDIEVNYNMSYVKKDGATLYFVDDSLMYAAILSDKNIYECEVKRIMQRAGNIAQLYKDKASFIARTGCNSNLNEELLTLSNTARNIKSSSELSSIRVLAEDIDDKNSFEDCKLW